VTMNLRVAAVAVGLALATGGAWGQAGTVDGKPVVAEVQANPAMWSVKGVHGTVYLFGTVHVMKPGVRWETAKEQAAFKSSGTLYLEIADTGEDAMKALQPMVLSLGMDTEHPLSTKISKDDVATLDAALKKMGAAGEASVEPMQPWLVYLTLSMLPAVQAGYDPSSGIDRVLQGEAKTANKPVVGFETAQDQMHVLADFPTAEQAVLLHETLEELPQSVEKTNEMVAEWERGDVDKIAAMEDGELRLKHPDLYQKLLVSRNEKMAATIAGLLKGPSTGTVFVAVGAAHLAGPDSLQAMLAKQGFVAVREE